MPTLRLSSKIIGITMGDPGGIGPEVTLKALRKKSISGKNIKFVLIGDSQVLNTYTKVLPSNCIFVDTKSLDGKKLIRGKTQKINGQASLAYLKTALKLYSERKIEALVTAPVSKEAISMVNPAFIGHTEFLAKEAGIEKVGMMFVSERLRTIIVTRHIPLKKVPSALTQTNILETITLTNQALKKHFRIRKPRIGVCGLNPHAGEGGRIGKEEITTIIPSIKKARRKGINASGPYAADTLFTSHHTDAFDCIVAMYHDQGLIPIKSLYFDKLVNLTIGLPYIRTSPAHGTGFDIAGKNQANPSSMVEAIKLAVQLS